MCGGGTLQFLNGDNIESGEFPLHNFKALSTLS